MVSQNRHPESCSPLLAELCGLYGVLTGYRDTGGKRRDSPVESVVAVLGALGAGLGDARVVGDTVLRAAIRGRRRELLSRLVEPVLVAWEGRLPPAVLHLAAVRGRPLQTGARLTLTLEDGTEMQWEESPDAGGAGVGRRAPRMPRLPYGYHRLRVETDATMAEATVISAPWKCWRPEQDQCSGASEVDQGATAMPAESPLDPLDALKGRPWGIFAPLYALRSERDWGAGDLAELASLRKWVGTRGGCAVSTLPLLAMFFDEPFDPSPYRPVSRLFWNEFYLAVDQIPEWERCAHARELWGLPDTQARVQALRAASLVDYQGVMALKRKVLERLTDQFFSNEGSERRQVFVGYVREHPQVGEYATFRAEKEQHLTAEQTTAAARYHLYCQWQMEEQLTRLSGDRGPGLFLDLPLGVHPEGFDAWRWPELFARGMSTGAPPDDFFSRGQDWTSPPLHPEESRRQGHQYFAQCLRHQMRHARYLRLDHVMSLHRLYWIPGQADAADGVYITYPADELYAVLCLESYRNRTVVVGEDLGTVPPEVRAGMRRHGVLRTWVLQSSLRPRARCPVGPVPRNAVAGLNTHDMFPFAGFVRGDDIEARVETRQLNREEALREKAGCRRLVDRLAAFLRAVQADESRASKDLLDSAIAFLAVSAAALVVVNLQDLLLETEPQNVPGTGAERPNWRRKILASQEDVEKAIDELGHLAPRRSAPFL